MCVYILKSCVLLGLDWVEPIMLNFFLLGTCSCTFHVYVPFQFLFFFWYLLWWCFSVYLLLSFSRIVCAWHPSANLLRLGTFFISRHLLLIPLLFTFGFVMRRPVRTSRRTVPNVVFIRNGMWFYRIFPILLFPLSYTVRDGNLYVIIYEFYSNMHGFDTFISWFVTQVRGTRIVVTPDLIFEILHILRVAHPDYLGC